ILPSAARAIISSGDDAIFIPSVSAIVLSLSLILCPLILENGRCWQRESTVGGIFLGSVVAGTKITWGGGSSRVFKRALKAEPESICASSIIYTLYRPADGAYRTFSLRSLILSTPVLEAPSISETSIEEPSATSRHDGHFPQGSDVGPL